MSLWIPSGYKESNSYVPPSWSDGTDEEIVEALTKHYNNEIDLTDFWSVGDERVISLSAMSSGWTGYSNPPGESQNAQDVVFVLTNIGGKDLVTPINGHTECVFQVDQKDCLQDSGLWGYTTNSSQYNNWTNSQRRLWCDSHYYNAIPSTIRPIFKQFIYYNANRGSESTPTQFTAYFTLRSEKEIYGGAWQGDSSSQVNDVYCSYYNSSTGRIKKDWWGDNNANYWLRTPKYNDNYYVCFWHQSNQSITDYPYQSYQIAPFGCI